MANKSSSQGKQTSKTEKFYPSNRKVALTSQWAHNGQGYALTYGPTKASTKLSVKYSIPSGATIKKSEVTMTKETPGTGTSVLRINGSSKKDTSGDNISFPVTISGSSGTFEIEFEYVANASVHYDQKTHTSTLTLANIALEITYKIDQKAETSDSKKEKTSRKFSLPPQCVAMIDQDDNKVYYFDGVVKIQHALSMKIEEEPDENKEINKGKYINNAKNEPDKVTLDVVMSDVYEGGGELVKASMTDTQEGAISTAKNGAGGKTGVTWAKNTAMTRSEKAFYKLHEIKEARKKMSLVTQQYVYTDMILASATVTHDEEHTFGWTGQIVLQHAYEPKKKQENWQKKSAGGTGIINQANLVSITGDSNPKPEALSGSST